MTPANSSPGGILRATTDSINATIRSHPRTGLHYNSLVLLLPESQAARCRKDYQTSASNAPAEFRRSTSHQ